MSSSVRNAKNIIDDQIKQGFYGDRRCPFIKYSKFYLKTNENITAYLKMLDLDKTKNALTVLSSGDHVFNLLALNINNIDTFDSNALTRYYALGLKKAMILKLNYQEFITTMVKLNEITTSLEEITTIILDLLPFMDLEYRNFWRNIAEYNYKSQKYSNVPLNLLLMLSMDSIYITKENIIEGNAYLENEKVYNVTKANLELANITFKNANATKLDKNFNKIYDTILLSNIPDFFWTSWSDDWNYNELKEYEEKLKNMTSESATIFLNYIFANRIKPVIKRSNIHISDLTNEEIKVIPSIVDNVKEDSVLLLRKRGNNYGN